MATSSPSTSLVKRSQDAVALMPPPPLKRIKRPPKVLDEDEYTSTLSDIIARDYFPGLQESKAQQEYLLALESNNTPWIAEAGQRLREAMTPLPANKTRRSARNTRFDTPSRAGSVNAATDTPRGYNGSETPLSVADTDMTDARPPPGVDASHLSLSAFQAKYTSEDNESFNDLLDKQNEKRRQRHAHLWTQDQRIPSARQIAHRAREARLLQQKAETEVGTGTAMIPMTSGATDSRPAQPDTWTIKKPDNTFMFNAGSIDEDGLQTRQEVREANSKASPKQVVHANTRFQSTLYLNDPGPIPPSPSLNTDIITRREAAAAAGSGSTSNNDTSGGAATPRVNGYSYVDEDEPQNLPPVQSHDNGPSYRDLLAGQVDITGPQNPFHLTAPRKRESLHHRMVEKTAKSKRVESSSSSSSLSFSSATPGGIGRGNETPGRATKGNMTPAARKLLEKLGRSTPVTGTKRAAERMSSKEMWTPTPRRKANASTTTTGGGGGNLK